MEPLTKDDIRKIFDRINPRYDLLNHVLSAGQDILWRKFTAKRIEKNSANILDIATGTGDMALEIARKLPHSTILGLDFSDEMLKLGKDKILRKNRSERIRLLSGDSMKLPFPNGYFDAVTAAFGFRNLPDKPAGLEEMKRVLRKGGKLLILEMTLPKGGIRGRFFKWYLKKVIPALGGFISGNKDAYEYLGNSIEGFLRPDELTGYLSKAGFEKIKTFPLSMGITCLHEGVVN